MFCLGIDQSVRSTGLCVTDENGQLIDYKLIRIDENKDDDYKWIAEEFDDKTFRNVMVCSEVADQLEEYLNEFDGNIDVVNIEGLAYGIKGDATRTLGGLQFMLVERLINEKLGIALKHGFTNDPNNNVMITAPTSLKKFATGNGSIRGKDPLYDAMPDDVKSLFGQYPKTKGRFDLVDAYWLSRYGVKEHASG